MKTKILFVVGFLMIALSSCQKDSDEILPPIQLSAEKVELKVGETQTLRIKGGDGKYTITSSSSFVAYELKGSSLSLTAKAVGKEIIIISSAGQKVELIVIVKESPSPVPDLGTKYGVYKDGQLLFNYAMKVSTKHGVWLCEKSEAPYQRRLFLSYLKGSLTVGGTVSLKIIAEGSIPSLPDTGDQGKVYSLQVKKLDTKFAYLLDEQSKLYFVVPRR